MRLTPVQELAYEHLAEVGSCTVECMAGVLQVERWYARNVFLQLERRGLARHTMHKRLGNSMGRPHQERYAIYKLKE